MMNFISFITKLMFTTEEPIKKTKKSATSAINNLHTPGYIPKLQLVKEIEKIHRDPDMNPCLFGSFVEYYLKFKYLGTINNYEVRKYLENPGQSELYKLIEKAHTKAQKDIMDICCLSFAHYLNTQTIITVDFIAFMHKIEMKKDYYERYFDDLNFKFPHCLTDHFLSYGGITGVPDILSNRILYEIKCREVDDTDYYRRQLFAYATLNYLQCSKEFEKAFVINFYTGKIFVMTLNNVDSNYDDFFNLMLTQ